MSTINIDQDSFFDSLILFIKGSMIFVVSQAWNSAVQDLITRCQLNEYSRFVYALLVTFAAVYILKMISNIKRIIDNCQSSLSAKCKNLFHLLGIKKDNKGNPPTF